MRRPSVLSWSASLWTGFVWGLGLGGVLQRPVWPTKESPFPLHGWLESLASFCRLPTYRGDHETYGHQVVEKSEKICRKNSSWKLTLSLSWSHSNFLFLVGGWTLLCARGGSTSLAHEFRQPVMSACWARLFVSQDFNRGLVVLWRRSPGTCRLTIRFLLRLVGVCLFWESLLTRTPQRGRASHLGRSLHSFEMR
jgi:hypothetical protein